MSYLGAEGDAFSRSIANALEAFRKGVDEELRKKDEVIHQLQAKNDEFKQKNNEAQQEIASLRAELATTKENSPSYADVGIQAPDVSGVENMEDEKKAPPVPYKDYARLVRDYNMLNSDNSAYKTAVKDLIKKAKKAKEAALQWKEYAAKYEKFSKTGSTLVVPPVRPMTPDSDLTSSRPSTAEPEKRPNKLLIEKVARSPLHLVETSSPPNGSRGDLVWPGHSDQNLPDADPVPNERHSEAGKVFPGSRSEVPSSSQTTESEAGTQFPSEDRLRIPSSPPVIVSEKILKRKRGPAAPIPFVVDDIGEGIPVKPIKIKAEPHSSPQEPTTARKLNRVETLDLDEVADRIDTPRKRRRQGEIHKQAGSFKSSPLSFLTHQRSTSLPPVARDEPIKVENLHPDIGEDTTSPLEDRAVSEPTAANTPGAHKDTPSRSKTTKVLHPISTNQKVLPRTSDIHEKHKARNDDRGAKALYAVAEDEEPAPTRKQLASPAAMNRKRIRIPPEIPPMNPREEKGRKQHDQDSGLDTPKIKQLPTPNIANSSRKPFNPRTPLSFHRGLRREAQNEDTPSRGRTDAPRSKGALSRPPLRSKPVEALNIDDFKLNPKAKGGLDLAYADPVRGREARRHMDACTDPNCANCGDQLQALAAELDITVGSALFASTQDEDLTNEERLIKFYLGDTFDRDRVKEMKPEIRTKMILQAKTRIMADRVSRHRVKPMGRAKSPPGFWDYDMPTTQQLEAQRQEADARQKEFIAERYREAMRPGGRWIFRDE